MKRYNTLAGVVLVLLTAYALLAFLIRVSHQQLDDGTENPKLFADSIDSIPTDNPAEKLPEGIVSYQALRIEREIPAQDYSESIVYVNNKEVSRLKSQGDKVLERSGQIPDGKVKFVNEGENTYGFENYSDGKREGPYVEYYSHNQIKIEAEYDKGRLMKSKSYFPNGVLQMEEDYTNARFIAQYLPLRELKKVGTGKIYRMDGSLKHEWYAVDNASESYVKSYDQQGNLLEATYYNDRGEPVESR